MPDSNVVSVSFVDRPQQSVVHINVVVPTGLSSFDHRLTIACHEKAFDYGYTHWVQPCRSAAEGEQWFVYAQTDARHRQFLRKLPSRIAAEMWVLHHE